MSEESLDLAQVQSAFREAEQKFQELAQAAQDLESVSSQLRDAQTGVSDAGTRLGELAQASQAVSEQLANAIRSIEATDPAEIQARLRELATRLDEHSQKAVELLSAISEAQDSVEANRQASQRIHLILSALILVAVIAVGVLIFVR